MKKTVGFLLVFFSLIVNFIFAQTIDEPISLDAIASIEPIIFVHKKRLINWQGVTKSIKMGDFEPVFDSTKHLVLDTLKQRLLIQQAEIMIIRDANMTVKTFWQRGQPDPLNNFTQLIKKGDRYIIEFTFAIHDNNGNVINLKHKPVFNLPLI